MFLKRFEAINSQELYLYIASASSSVLEHTSTLSLNSFLCSYHKIINHIYNTIANASTRDVSVSSVELQIIEGWAVSLDGGLHSLCAFLVLHVFSH